MPRTPDYFAGKTILITGAASGIGRATALIFARERANVVCADINQQGARDTAAAVNAAGSQALALATDVTSRAQVGEMVARAVAAFGAVHFLFNSAGAAIRRAKFLDIDDALRSELEDRLQKLGYAGDFQRAFDEWAGAANLEERTAGVERIDPVVLAALRKQSG